jgi:hypothetical protein
LKNSLVYQLIHSKRVYKVLNTIILLFFIEACIDPVPPEFDFVEDLIIVDALTSTLPGTTYATVRKTILEFGIYKSEFVSGCKVYLINSKTQETISLIETELNYLAPSDFKVDSGSEWEMEVIMPDGKTYVSQSEIVPEVVPISNISENYNKEMRFDEANNKFIPGHEIRINFQEPSDQENYYYFQYRSYEKEIYCNICYNGVLRFGECISQIENPQAKQYYTYTCDQACWQINYSQEITLFDDALTNGKSIENLLVARIPLNSKQDMLAEILQLNITAQAHKYYKTIKDIVDNNGGFNAPLPSALIGNFYNPSDLEDPILGRFTAAAASNQSLFVKRGSITDQYVGYLRPPQSELFGDPLPNPLTYDAPCLENRNRTAIQPPLWNP